MTDRDHDETLRAQLEKVRAYLIRLSKGVVKPAEYGVQVVRRDRNNGDIEYQIFADTKGNGRQIAWVQSSRHDAQFIAACLAQAALFETLLRPDAALRVPVDRPQEQFPIPLNAEQERSIQEWAADDRLWTTQETVEINLRTFARIVLRDVRVEPNHSPVDHPRGHEQEPRRFCRDCADSDGVCPHDGSFCSAQVQRRHEEILRARGNEQEQADPTRVDEGQPRRIAPAGSTAPRA